MSVNFFSDVLSGRISDNVFEYMSLRYSHNISIPHLPSWRVLSLDAARAKGNKLVCPSFPIVPTGFFPPMSVLPHYMSLKLGVMCLDHSAYFNLFKYSGPFFLGDPFVVSWNGRLKVSAEHYSLSLTSCSSPSIPASYVGPKRIHDRLECTSQCALHSKCKRWRFFVSECVEWDMNIYLPHVDVYSVMQMIYGKKDASLYGWVQGATNRWLRG